MVRTMKSLPPCPHCDTAAPPYRWGRSAGQQRYRCRDCGRSFNALTGTPLAGLAHRHRWRRYLDGLDLGHSVRRMAQSCRVAPSTIQRWRQRLDPAVAVKIVGVRAKVIDLKKADYRTANDDAPMVSRPFSFIDLFAGIGGIRLGFQDVGGQCVFTSEWNPYARTTYAANFPADRHVITGDITMVDQREVPDHDVLLAGFPCQPFSIAGISKRNALGRAHGFGCKTQGTLFFDVARIIAAKRPRAFLIENVKNLVAHDGGRTFDIIRETLEAELGYHVQYRVIDAARFLPQRRERIYIVGFRDRTDFSFDDILVPATVAPLSSILDADDPRYILTEGVWRALQGHALKHVTKGNGFGYGLITPDTTATRTLSARYYKDGAEILLSRGDGEIPRRLTPRECSRLMGFPDDWLIPVSDTQAYRQFGNSVAVPVVREIARLMALCLGQAETVRLAA